MIVNANFPTITSVETDPVRPIVGQLTEVSIFGFNFGEASNGLVQISGPGGVVGGVNSDDWGDEEIDLYGLTFETAGTYTVTVWPDGGEGDDDALSGTFEVDPAAAQPATCMALQQVGPTVISADGIYSENTTIQVQAVNCSDGSLIPSFTGAVGIAEDIAAAGYIPIYSQNTSYGASLPASVTIPPGGTAIFLAKSLAGPVGEGTGGAAPNAALIKSTNYPIYGGADLAIPQWIISGAGPGPGNIDSHAIQPVYD